MKNQLAESIHMEFNDNSVLSSLFGVSDSNIQLLEKINNVNLLLCESTTCDKNREFNIKKQRKEFVKDINEFLNKRTENNDYKKILIPSFALGRAQEIITLIMQGIKDKKII